MISEAMQKLVEAIDSNDKDAFLEAAKQCDLNERLPNNNTILMKLISRDWGENSDFMLQYLVEHHIDLDATNDRGFTALGYLVSDRKFERAEKLVDMGANVNVQSMIRIYPRQEVMGCYQSVPYQDVPWRNISPLCIAIYKLESPLALKMIEKGADVNYIGELDITPLSMAIRMELTDVQEALIEKGANPNTVPQNWREYSHKEDFVCPVALKKALKYGNVEGLGILLQSHVRIPDLFPRQNNQFSTPLTYLLSQNKNQLKGVWGCVDLLLTSHVNIDLTDSFGRTPLSYAVEKGYSGLVPFLITDKSKNKADKEGKTPALYAYQERQFKVLDFLFESGVSLEQVSPNTGKSLLMCALDERDDEMALFLLERNPNLLRKDKKGQTVLDFASKKGVVAQKVQAAYQIQKKMIDPSGRGF